MPNQLTPRQSVNKAFLKIKPIRSDIEGFKRRGFSREAITAIRNAYKLLYRSGKTLEEAKPEIAELANKHPEVNAFMEFFDRSTRGLIR